MNIMEMGQLLRTQRESLGLSIEELSEKTCISRRILAVFEAGEVEEYPHSVYAKGFIRNYARALSLDEELCLRALEKEFGVQVQEDADGNPVPSFENLDSNVPVGKSGSPWLVFLGSIVFVGILAGLVWYFSFSGLPGSAKTQSTIQSQQSVEEPVADPVLEAVEPALEQVTELEVLTVEQSQEENSQQPVPSLPVQASAGQTGQEAVLPATSVALSRPGEQAGLHTLGIKVVGEKECWVGVLIPGQENFTRKFTVPAGKREEYRFSGERIIRFGRMETVELTFDGKPRPVRGRGVVDVTLP